MSKTLEQIPDLGGRRSRCRACGMVADPPWRYVEHDLNRAR